MLSERTHLHPTKALERIIDGAARMGELDRLFWMVEIKVAAKLAGTKQPVIAAASYPLGWVPVVAVGSDPKRSRHYIDGGGYQAYEWGDALWDCVCVACGAVWASTGIGEEVCGECH